MVGDGVSLWMVYLYVSLPMLYHNCLQHWPNLPHLNPPEAWDHGHRCHRCQGSLPVYDFWAVGRASRHGDGSKLPMKFRDDWGIVVLHPAILGYF
jgi:hypothetical protein